MSIPEAIWSDSRTISAADRLGVGDQGPRRGQGVAAARAGGQDAVGRLDHVARAADQQAVARRRRRAGRPPGGGASGRSARAWPAPSRRGGRCSGGPCSFASNRSSSAKPSAALPANPTRTWPSSSLRTLTASAFMTVVPSVTWPSPPRATRSPRRTERIVVACQSRLVSLPPPFDRSASARTTMSILPSLGRCQARGGGHGPGGGVDRPASEERLSAGGDRDDKRGSRHKVGCAQEWDREKAGGGDATTHGAGRDVGSGGRGDVGDGRPGGGMGRRPLRREGARLRAGPARGEGPAPVRADESAGRAGLDRRRPRLVRMHRRPAERLDGRRREARRSSRPRWTPATSPPGRRPPSSWTSGRRAAARRRSGWGSPRRSSATSS